MPAVVSRSSRRRPINEINMVPFIDVMLVLLIIFMVTAPMLRPGKIDLPKVGSTHTQQSQAIRLVLMPDGQMTLQDGERGTPVPVLREHLLSELQRMLHGRSDVAVLIEADRQLKYDDVMQAYAQLQGAGISHIALSALSAAKK
ncbi:MAG: ExbD/TolR family protein [Brachymonas sp.]|uniref:ExbD/TolR family protein n=1 Tax=Brachymonas sp. TaxID=1936292 RepID=UPI0035B311D5